MAPRSYRGRRGPQGRPSRVAALALAVAVAMVGCAKDSSPTARGAARGAERDGGRPSLQRVHAVLVNGGDRPDHNYQSHFLHVRELIRLLLLRGVPQRNIVVFASDGTDPAPDLAVLEQPSERRFWLLAGTELGARLRPEVHLVDSEIEGVEHLPATQDALRTWFKTEAARLEPGSDLLLYVTDHGRKNPANLRNNALMLWGDALDVEGLRGLLRNVPPGVRTVMLMSQCFSGSFAYLLYGGEGNAPDGSLCGFFSSPPDRYAYGCYPENRGKDNVGHSFEFLDGLRALGAFDRAHDEVLLTDDTPDVPNRTSGHWLGTLLHAHAARFGLAYEEFADSLLEKAWLDEAFFGPTFARIDELAKRFGATAPRTFQDLSARTKAMPGLRDELRSYARRWDAAFRALKEANLARFLDAHPRWNERLRTGGLGSSTNAEHPRLPRSFLRALARFTHNDTRTRARLRTLRSMAHEAERGAYRMEVRLAVALRMREMLGRVAGEVFLDDYGTQAERAAYEALLDCESFTLGDGLGSRTRLRAEEPFPPLDEELRLLATVLPGWLGVRFQPLEGKVREGLGVQVGAVAVTGIDTGSPAERSGIRVGDVILGSPGDYFREPQQIREWVMTSIAGETRELDILRDGETFTVPVAITAPPEHSR